jgi:hypothetical protein
VLERSPAPTPGNSYGVTRLQIDFLLLSRGNSYGVTTASRPLLLSITDLRGVLMRRSQQPQRDSAESRDTADFYIF